MKDLSILEPDHFSGGRKVTGPRSDELAAILNSWQLKNTGTIAAVETAAWGGQPADADTVTIGGHIFEFDTASPPVAAAGTRTAVKIGASLAATLAVLRDAVNGRSDPANITPGSAAAASVLADVTGNDTKLRLRYADERGGNAIAGPSGSIALTKSGANIGAWQLTNMNLAGGTAAINKSALVDFSVNAEHIALTEWTILLPFTATKIIPLGVVSGGVIAPTNDTVVVSSGNAKVTFAGGALPNLQAGDVFWFIALGA